MPTEEQRCSLLTRAPLKLRRAWCYTVDTIQRHEMVPPAMAKLLGVSCQAVLVSSRTVNHIEKVPREHTYPAWHVSGHL